MVTNSEKIKEAAEEAPQQNLIADSEQLNTTPKMIEVSMQERAKEPGQNSKEPSKDPEVEEGEVSSDSSSEEDSSTNITPKKPNRGRKRKKEEREKETYRDVLNGS